ncbi:hypothetical protein ACFL1Q_01440 [Patescibacteria group bacterium]
MKKIIAAVFIFLFIVSSNPVNAEDAGITWWSLQSIDSVKYSRDLAREKATNKSFEAEIEKQVSAVATTGATHIAIGTPYDEEFYPFMKKWVSSARKYGLNVWFRGNFSGWEGWFEYPIITRAQHLELTKKFISDNKDVFVDGDIFSSCAECENGGAGDPRHNGDVAGFRQFLVDSYKVSKEAFRLTGKNVLSNYFPMNGDVAKLIMNPETTNALGGIVVIDHYVATPERLNADINEIAKFSQGKVVLGEFGAPIPDIHGNMNEDQQADWIGRSLALLSANPNLIGVNYWTGFGGSTHVWNSDGTPRKSVEVISGFFKPKLIGGVVKNEIGWRIKNAKVRTNEREVLTDSKGRFSLPTLSIDAVFNVSKDKYISKSIKTTNDGSIIETTLVKEQENFLFRLLKAIFQKFTK